MRIIEHVNLPIKAIDGDRMHINIKKSKGRCTILSSKKLDLLRVYFKTENHHYWLFEGMESTKKKPLQYFTRSIQNILKEALKKTGFKKPVTADTLRTSFEMNFLENWPKLR